MADKKIIDKAKLDKKTPLSTSNVEVKVHQSQGVSRQARRVVFQRDQSCQYVHQDGRRCGSRYQLQVDHIHSQWLGGGHGIENLQLLCGMHNRDKYRREINSQSP